MYPKFLMDLIKNKTTAKVNIIIPYANKVNVPPTI